MASDNSIRRSSRTSNRRVMASIIEGEGGRLTRAGIKVFRRQLASEGTRVSRRIENENQDGDDDDVSVILLNDSGDNDDDDQGASDIVTDNRDMNETVDLVDDDPSDEAASASRVLGTTNLDDEIIDVDEPTNTFLSDQINADPMDEDNEVNVENMETIEEEETTTDFGVSSTAEEAPIEVDDQLRPIIPHREGEGSVTVNLRRVNPEAEAEFNGEETIDLEVVGSTAEEAPIEVDDQFRPIPHQEVSVNRRVNPEADLSRDETIDLEADEDLASPRVESNVGGGIEDIVDPMIEDNDVGATAEEVQILGRGLGLRHRAINLHRDEPIDLEADEDQSDHNLGRFNSDIIDLSSPDASNRVSSSGVRSSPDVINLTNTPTVSNNNLASEDDSQRPGPSTSGSSLVLTCPVCLEDLVDIKRSGLDIMATSCGHILCAPCLDRVVKMSPGNIRCPMCRSRLSGKTKAWQKIHL